MIINKFNNVYGIKGFNKSLDLSKDKCSLIYANNGTMKTSLVKALKNITNSKEIEERWFHKMPDYDVTIFNKNYTNVKSDSDDRVICFVNEYDKVKLSNIEGIVSLIKNDFLKKEIEEEWEKRKISVDKLYKILKSKFNFRDNSKVNNIICRITNANKELDWKQVIDFLRARKWENKFIDKNLDCKLLEILLDNKVKVFMENSDKIKAYREHIFTKKSSHYTNDSFTFNELEQIHKLFSDKNKKFFNVGNKLVIKDLVNNIEEIIDNKYKLNDLYNRVLNDIYKSEDTLNLIKIIEKELTGSVSKKIVSYMINENNSWVFEETENLDNFLIDYFESVFSDQKEIIIEYLNEVKNVEEYFKSKEKLINEYDDTKWDKIIKDYNELFDFPFDVRIENRYNSILGYDSPQFVFEVKDSEGNVNKNFDSLMDDTLSSGEKKVVFFLELLFSINIVKEKYKNESPILLILDDLVESFDYKNKHSILKYLFDFIHDNKKNKLIILSHNFDFIRSCQYDLNKTKTIMVSKNKTTGLLDFCDFFDKDSKELYDNKDNAIKVFKNWIDNLQNSDNKKYIVTALLPVLRNINSIVDDSNLLDESLHYYSCQNKKWLDLTKIYSRWGIKLNEVIILNDNIIDTIINNSNNIIKENNFNSLPIYDLLKRKIILSISIRLLVEKCLVILLEKEEIKIKEYRLSSLHSLLRNNKNYPDDLRFIVRKALSMTNELIHINSFMYEPLIDLDIENIIELYKQIISYINNNNY
ncbi:hypothetical protein SCORR_v1c05900 [Spiroplasma corruscae]|uniref:Protein CR006 P-loop domain-containing protein n=1 Tax=Spiroplasma corruscae TaxID=216934 RepID=A0A222EPF0_9MOLU|nr:hypothetical protein [Spiroplasma corruscae]ASP28362.1 hypothetical protein SCORR_v1c05900 [Spiroplasma corruscae]